MFTFSKSVHSNEKFFKAKESHIIFALQALSFFSPALKRYKQWQQSKKEWVEAQSRGNNKMGPNQRAPFFPDDLMR